SPRSKAPRTIAPAARKPLRRRQPAEEQAVVLAVVETISDIVADTNDQTNAIDLLKEDHDRVGELFVMVKANESGDNRDAFERIRRELETHTHVEEEIFYPHLLIVGNEELQRLTGEARVGDGQVAMLLDELGALGEGPEDFNAKLQALFDVVEHHFEKEEGELFPLVRDQLDDEALLTLGAQILEERARFGGTTLIASAVG